jgi:hypothetical protein
LYKYASVKGVGEMAGWKHHDSIEVTEKILQTFISEKIFLQLYVKKIIGESVH